MTISNFVSNGALSMELMKGNLFNEKTKRKAYEQKMHRPSSQKVKEETGMDDRKVMTSLRESPSPVIKSNVFIMENKGV